MKKQMMNLWKKVVAEEVRAEEEEVFSLSLDVVSSGTHALASEGHHRSKWHNEKPVIVIIPHVLFYPIPSFGFRYVCTNNLLIATREMETLRGSKR